MALAASRGVGVRRRLAQLDPDHATNAARATRRAAPAVPSPVTSRTGTVQLACRIDRALHARLRRQAARAGQTLRTFVIHALARALTAARDPRGPAVHGASSAAGRSRR